MSPQGKLCIPDADKIIGRISISELLSSDAEVDGFGVGTRSIDAIRERLSVELTNLPDSIKAITNPRKYTVEFAFLA